MKGVVFTEFMEMTESAFSADTLDRVITSSGVPNGGAYTSVGTYDHREMVSLVVALSAETGQPVPELLRAFGHHLAGAFARAHPRFFDVPGGLFDFIESIDHYIHVEVRKLYPDAELPSFETSRPDAATLRLLYRSGRAMGDLALGLLEAASKHFAEPVAIAREDRSGGAGTEVLFTLTRA